MEVMTLENIKSHLVKMIIEQITDRITVILFGSRARQDNRPDSDLDLLVLLDKDGSINSKDIGRITFPFYQLSDELKVEVNPLVYTRQDWEKRSFLPFYKNVIKDGITIWG